MQTEHAVSGCWDGEFDEGQLQSWAEGLRRNLREKVSLGLIFINPRLFPHAAQILEIARVHAQIPLLAGCSSSGLIAGGREAEGRAGIVLALFSFPDAELRAHHFTQEQVEVSNGPDFWHQDTDVGPDATNGWLAFTNPFQLDSDEWLAQWNQAYAPAPILGGLASGDFSEQRTQVYLNGEVFEEGGVAVSFGGGIGLLGVTSQGCTPIGETWTITKVHQNIIQEIANRPAYEVLVHTVQNLSLQEQKRLQGNLFIGLVINEYLEEFHRGDFLVRNLLGADPQSGALAVGALPRAGQTVQFQRRDAEAASSDLRELLDRARDVARGSKIYGGCLCSCNGRGSRLFGQPNHDAGLVQERLGPLGLAGFFCNGEIGPVGQRSFLHGYTASLALFLKKN